MVLISTIHKPQRPLSWNHIYWLLTEAKAFLERVVKSKILGLNDFLNESIFPILASGNIQQLS